MGDLTLAGVAKPHRSLSGGLEATQCQRIGQGMPIAVIRSNAAQAGIAEVRSMDRNTVYRVNGPRVIFENIEGELILVNMEKGCYYSTDQVGADVWAFIEAG